MRTGKGRVRMKGCQVPVTLGRLGGVRVGPGDVVVADADGVLVVPRMAAGDILAAALEIERVETEIRRAIQAGSSLEAARTTFGYHELQSARKIT